MEMTAEFQGNYPHVEQNSAKKNFHLERQRKPAAV